MDVARKRQIVEFSSEVVGGVSSTLDYMSVPKERVSRAQPDQSIPFESPPARTVMYL